MIKSKQVEPGGRLPLRRIIMLFKTILSVGLLSAVLPSGSLEPVCDSLQAVTVTADRGVTVSMADTLRLKNSLSVSDVLMECPALHVGDNGGYSGLKTVSLRGLGSAHTSIYVDGVRVGNVQSGQADISLLDVSDLGSIVVDYAQNSLSFSTARPAFGTAPVAAKVRLDAGSFGTWLPSARMDFRLCDSFSLRATASGVFSDGDFPCADGQLRLNNDVSRVRAGLDLFGVLQGGDMHIKAFFNGVERGTPGSLSWPSDDRQKDLNAFVQGILRKRFSRLYSLNISAKGSYDDIFYTSSYGDSRYAQNEVQLNSSHYFRLGGGWTVSLAADLQWDALSSTVYDASRLSATAVVASSLRRGRVSAEASVEYVAVVDLDAACRNAWSPSLNLRVNLLEGLDLMAFGRRAYRVPTFNELYYVGYGNPDLSPEDAWLTDLGLDLSRPLSGKWRLSARVDGFLNILTDKITSAPTPEDPAIWQPYNIGKVRSAGLDTSLGFIYAHGSWKCESSMKYSFQSAVDCTEGSASYMMQIPHVARHVMVVRADASYGRWILDASWQMRSGRTDGYSDMPSWHTLDLSFGRSFDLAQAGSLMLRLCGRNLYDFRYETVSGYPMPGRSLMFNVEYEF